MDRSMMYAAPPLWSPASVASQSCTDHMELLVSRLHWGFMLHYDPRNFAWASSSSLESKLFKRYVFDAQARAAWESHLYDKIHVGSGHAYSVNCDPGLHRFHCGLFSHQIGNADPPQEELIVWIACHLPKVLVLL